MSAISDRIVKTSLKYQARTHEQFFLDKFFFAELDAETRPCVRTPSFQLVRLVEKLARQLSSIGITRRTEPCL